MSWLISMLLLVAKFLKDHPEVLALIEEAINKLRSVQSQAPKKCCEVTECLDNQEKALLTALEENCHIRCALEGKE